MVLIVNKSDLSAHWNSLYFKSKMNHPPPPPSTPRFPGPIGIMTQPTNCDTEFTWKNVVAILLGTSMLILFKWILRFIFCVCFHSWFAGYFGISLGNDLRRLYGQGQLSSREPNPSFLCRIWSPIDIQNHLVLFWSLGHAPMFQNDLARYGLHIVTARNTLHDDFLFHRPVLGTKNRLAEF